RGVRPAAAAGPPRARRVDAGHRARHAARHVGQRPPLLPGGRRGDRRRAARGGAVRPAGGRLLPGPAGRGRGRGRRPRPTVEPRRIRMTSWLGQYCINVTDLYTSVAFYETLGLACTSRTSIPEASEAIVENPAGGSRLQLARPKDQE